MKTTLRFLLGAILLTGHALPADEIVTESIGSEKMPQPDKVRPWQITVEGDYVGRTKIDKDGYHGEHLKFAEVTTELTRTCYYDPAYSEGATVTVGYDYTHFNWKENPDFNETDFNTGYIGLDLFSDRLCDWHWLGEVGVNIDTDHFDFDDYAFYDFTLWGRYKFSRNIGFHIGFIAQTGLEINRVYPIVGLDWEIDNCWKLNLVFPVNVSLVYTINKQWSIAAAGRLFDTRHRVGSHEPLSKAIFEYRNVGIEIATNYSYNSTLTANLHVGTTVWGRFKIANRHNKHSHHFDLKPAPYVGGEIEIKF